MEDTEKLKEILTKVSKNELSVEDAMQALTPIVPVTKEAYNKIVKSLAYEFELTWGDAIRDLTYVDFDEEETEDPFDADSHKPAYDDDNIELLAAYILDDEGPLLPHGTLAQIEYLRRKIAEYIIDGGSSSWYEKYCQRDGSHGAKECLSDVGFEIETTGEDWGQ